MSAPQTCPNCRNGVMTIFFTQQSVPVNSCILMSSVEEAKNYPRGNIELGFCSECGFVSNTTFDPALIEYSARYEETQGFSPTFNTFHEDLAKRVVSRYSLNEKEILEIGCGKGEFLNLVCKLGNNKGVGFDPGYAQGREEIEKNDNVEFIQDFYSDKYSEFKGDFVCCKMTLEHIPNTADFIDQVGHSIDVNRGTVVFFQVPDANRILKDCAFEDIYYEHCSYFHDGSLARLFHNYGLNILSVDTEYDNQYLTIEAKAVSDEEQTPLPKDDQLDTMAQLAASFDERYRERVGKWQKTLDQYWQEDKKVVVWGSGSKGVAFLSSLESNDRIQYVVDINPYRQNHYMAGFGQKIAAPEFLQDYRPDLVVVMNRIYQQEISESLVNMGLSPQVLAL